MLLISIPKILALLEDQLHRLAPRLHEGSIVVGTGKATEIHTSTLNLFEQLVGPTRTSLAVRKARLIFAQPDVTRVRPRNPWPLSYPLPVDRKLGAIAGREVTNYAGVFCADRLDIGTRFFLQYLPVTHGGDHIVDLGCGNGVVGTAAALANPTAQLDLHRRVVPGRRLRAGHLRGERRGPRRRPVRRRRRDGPRRPTRARTWS